MKTTYSPSRKNLEQKVTKLIAAKIKVTLKKKPFCILGIPGGRSVKGVFSLLTKQKLPWDKIHIFFVDERLVPPASDQSNSKQASRYFKQNLHAFNYKQPITSYTKKFRSFQNRFDIIILGLGEDGHVASLFPSHPSIQSQANYFIKVSNSPKSPKTRISASRDLLKRSTTAILLAFGKEKTQALKNFKNQKTPIVNCPAKLIHNIKDSYLFTDIK